jgi:hypothetical protein
VLVEVPSAKLWNLNKSTVVAPFEDVNPVVVNPDWI